VFLSIVALSINQRFQREVCATRYPLVLPLNFRAFGPQASSPALSLNDALVATLAGEDACGPRRARPINRKGLLKGTGLFSIGAKG